MYEDGYFIQVVISLSPSFTLTSCRIVIDIKKIEFELYYSYCIIGIRKLWAVQFYPRNL